MILSILLSIVIFEPLVSDWHVLPKITYIPKSHLIEMVRQEADVVIPDTMEWYHIWLIYETASRLDIPIRIAFRLFKQESNFDPAALNPKSGAKGYGQMLESTWLYMLLKSDFPLDLEMTPARNIVMSLKYYDYLRTRWRNKGLNEAKMTDYILASYNAGIGRVMAYNGIPPFEETRNYIAFIQNENKSN